MIFVLNRSLGKLTQKERLPSSRLVEAKGLLFFCVNKRCCNAFLKFDPWKQRNQSGVREVVVTGGIL